MVTETNVNNAEKDMKELSLKLSLDETNLVLEGLGQLKFVRVVELVSTIQNQARAQMDGPASKSAGDAAIKKD